MKDIFHIHIKAREKYQISDFSLYSIRKIAKALPGSASSLNAIILIHRIFHHICLRYREEKEGNVFNDSFVWIANRVSFFEDTLFKFTDEFSLERKDFIEELLLLSLAYENPSFSLYKRLFSLKRIKYKEIKGYIFEYFKEKPIFGPFNQSLPEMLKTPQRLFPNSLSGQLLYIKDNWAHLLTKELLENLLLALDLIKEEEALRMMGKAPLEVLDFKGDFLRGFGPDYERFSKDAFWMPKVVMLAKNTYVWLHQLSKKYGRWIRRLDDVPHSELDELASYGFNAIWL
ncbi:MAG: hypothetical protein AB1297_09475, partial [bacterium]